MSSDDDDDVQLYNALERNRKRQRELVTLSSSSESESDDDDVEAFDDQHSASSFTSPIRKRLRNGVSPSPAKRAAKNTVEIEDEEEKEEYVDDLLTPAERAQEQARGRELDREIAERIQKDQLLNQTRAIMRNVRLQIASEPPSSAVVELDSDEDDDVVEILPTPRNANGATLSGPSPRAAVSAASAAGEQSKGDRITLQVRSNGTKTDEIVMYMREPFGVLYDRFCDLHGLPRSAVQMSLDGEDLKLADTPQSCDLESGDLIDAKVDFSKADAQKKKRLVRLRLVVEGKRPEKFRIDVTSTMEKLLTFFCKRHQIADPDDVVMTFRGDPVRLRDTVESHDVFEDDEIHVEIKNYVDPATIELSVRYDAKTTRTHLVVPTNTVASLIAQVASHLSVDASRINLVVDGEGMESHKKFQTYDLEGGELIDVKVRA